MSKKLDKVGPRKRSMSTYVDMSRIIL